MPGPNDVCCIPTTVDQAVGWPCLIATYGNVKTSSAGPRNRLLSAEDAVRRVRLRGRELINTVTRQRLTSTGSRPIAAGGVFSVNDRSTLELDLRRSRRANPRWRQQSFAEAGRRSRQSRCRTAASDGYELALSTLCCRSSSGRADLRGPCRAASSRSRLAKKHHPMLATPHILMLRKLLHTSALAAMTVHVNGAPRAALNRQGT